jgi:hypothetical protein
MCSDWRGQPYCGRSRGWKIAWDAGCYTGQPGRCRSLKPQNDSTKAACASLDELDALAADVGNQTREAGGVLRLVAHTTATIQRLVPLISGFKRNHPKGTIYVTRKASQNGISHSSTTFEVE